MPARTSDYKPPFYVSIYLPEPRPYDTGYRIPTRADLLVSNNRHSSLFQLEVENGAWREHVSPQKLKSIL
jgi:hypothetical protein